MAYETINDSVESGVATIELNRPDAPNVITREMHNEWVGRLEAARQEDDVRVVVIQGAGRAFPAGHDLKQDVEPPLRKPRTAGRPRQ